MAHLKKDFLTIDPMHVLMITFGYGHEKMLVKLHS